MYDYVIVGAGFSGAVVANILAEKHKKVLLIDKRSTIAGNMYDYVNNYGILVHKYGPHILTINDDEVFSYLSKFTEWNYVDTKLETYIDGQYVPLPVNLNTIKEMTGVKYKDIEKKILEFWTLGEQINILDMMKVDDQDIQELANNIYEKIFWGYNIKMWGTTPDKVDKNVLGRAPIKISYDNKKNYCKYEVVPRNGYTEMFSQMLENNYIYVRLNTDARSVISIKDNKILFEGKEFKGNLIYTGPIDELFDFKYGHLPYRALYFKVENKQCDFYYNSFAVTFPMNYKKTRTSEMKRITLQEIKGQTTLVSEYPGEYNKDSKMFCNPSYPIDNDDSKKMLELYKKECKLYSNLHVVGRLGEFKYYNMEETIISAINLSNKLL